MDVDTSSELQDDDMEPKMKRNSHIGMNVHDHGLVVEGLETHDTQDTEQHTENESSLQEHELVEGDADVDPAEGDQTPVYCILCDAEVRGKWAYRKHIIKHQDAAQRGHDPTEDVLVPFQENQEELPLAYTLHCHLCPFETNVPRDLEVHYHSHVVGYKCLLCDFMTLHKTRLAAHYPLHKREKARLECRLCNATLSSTSALKKHIARHSEGTICCDLCDYKTYDQFLLREHMATKHNEVRKKYKCEHCDKEFGTFKRFFQHRQEVHKGFVYKRQVDPKYCDKCDFQTTKVKEMNAHKLMHQGLVDVLANGRYLCKIQGCADMFGSATKYEQHFTKVHDKDNVYGLMTKRTYNCPSEGCTFSSVRESHLKLHMRVHRAHNKADTSKTEKKKRAQGTCHICMAKFSDKYKVRSHIETVHSNSKPHECEMCCYKTAYKYNMKIHMKKLHNMEYNANTTGSEVVNQNQAGASFQEHAGSAVTFLHTAVPVTHERQDFDPHQQDFESGSEYEPEWE